MIIRNILGILLLAISYLAAILAIMLAAIPIFIWLKAGKLSNEIRAR